LVKGKYSKADFTEIYSIFYNKILEFLLKKVTNKEIAEDLTEEVFEKIFKTIQDYQWQGISISAWIYRIARNHLIDYYRKQNKYKNDKSFDDVVNIVESNLPSLETELVQNEEDIFLFRALKELDEDEQYLIYYKFFEEMSNTQISQIMGQTETNIGTRLHRIRKKIEKIIKIKSNEQVF
jgi:RNA polymerase sigma-70 factor (ECF subfamily)